MKTEPAPGGRRRVVIYCRISDDREGRKYGVKRQERECRKLAAELDVDVVAVLIENDMSAYSGKPRKKYNRLMEMLRGGEADGVLALTSRRLQRRFREAFDFLDLVEERGLLVATVKGGRYDLTTADGRKEARRKAIDDQGEVEELGERVRDAKQDNVRDGTYRGGPRPFGFEADGVTPRSLLCPACGATDGCRVEQACAKCGATDGFTAERECEACDAADGFTVACVCGDCGAEAVLAQGSEAWYVEPAIDALLAGDSVKSIVRDWAAWGVRTVPRRKRLEDDTRTDPVSREWDDVALRKMLLRARNAGLLEVSTVDGDGRRRFEVVGKAVWPGIVSEEKWRAVRALLEDPRRRTTPGGGRRWLGSGLYRCGVDGCTLTLRASTTGWGGIRNLEKRAERQAAKDAGVPLKTSKPAYRCKSGKHVTRDALALDAYVERVAVERLSREDAVRLFLPAPEEGEPTEKLAARANALREQLDEFATDRAEGHITRSQMLKGTERVRAQLAEVEAEMESRATVPVLGSLPLGKPEIKEAWKGYSLDRKRAIIGAIMTVTVLPARMGRPRGVSLHGRYFDPDAVRIEPRGERLAADAEAGVGVDDGGAGVEAAGQVALASG